MHALRGIRTRNLRNRADTDPIRSPDDHRDRDCTIYMHNSWLCSSLTPVLYNHKINMIDNLDFGAIVLEKVRCVFLITIFYIY
jgi:hypothetical protein